MKRPMRSTLGGLPIFSVLAYGQNSNPCRGKRSHNGPGRDSVRSEGNDKWNPHWSNPGATRHPAYVLVPNLP